MSFFGFDSALPRDRDQDTKTPGFGQTPDPFAGLSYAGADDDDDALDFEDTYDGLGDQLDETDDVFNDDTFGGEDTTAKKAVGKDFDFFGQTAKVSGAISEEQMRFTRQQPASRHTAAVTTAQTSHTYTQPARSGYEKYKDLDYVPDLQADADLWGTSSKTVPATQALPSQPPATSATRKMMSVEEVEAAMRAQAKKPTAAPAPQPQQQPQHPDAQFAQGQFQHQKQYQQYPEPQQFPQHVLQFPQHAGQQMHGPPRPLSGQYYEPQERQPQQIHAHQPVQILHRTQAPSPQGVTATSQPQAPPIQILRNPNRLSGEQQRQAQAQSAGRPGTGPSPGPPNGPGHRHNNSGIITHPHQLSHLNEEERATYLMEDAKRAKRNHKIFLLSKDNGLMTPQDKNFITRIQLQQLVTATGNPNEQGTDNSLSEDFYYQVHNQIRGGPRQHPNQPLTNFAQTYLFQTGGRHGGMRRQARSGDNHVQRMEQQVQRAVEAAKNKPKNKQLVIEGSLGKISFSNSKTPKPLLNIKRNENENRQKVVSSSDRKTILRDIENVYNTLMQMEDHDRHLPPPLTEDVDPALVGLHMDWQEKTQKLNNKLWQDLKVHELIGATATHPFIAFLSFSKGKKAIPRVFRHITQQQRTTILTMIVVHLDQLDVVRQALLAPGETQLTSQIRENIELFSLAVMPSLFGFLNEAGLDIVDALLALIMAKTNIEIDARTRIGVSTLTMLLSRAELIKQATTVDDQEWNHWLSTYNSFFDVIEPTLPYIFPGTVNTGEDVYVWQFLAAMGVGASPEQQQRLVMAVKDRVMETVNLAKTLPPAMSSQRLANVNLFMRSIGLDVDLLV
ncbi:hypothetical protein VC83_05522 [Pseudogymnoascus destructans]|uniref:mRNA decay factor PAT1 domain-containing protein n=2 Tax=Pseudogymnoascus destructans TaxID=655981 RepID=L8G9Q8_PSED2|nr:uncharacterized protein VC83_05522 [Pseudogymnoascus destructans]ELR09579.1 hypothetical protein GMDG_04073 [Pseudogymnoascus destructans 20631-21]OAF57761.1 hypothetical protein VC83_05522 [Pseudogymnoascus destructans]